MAKLLGSQLPPEAMPLFGATAVEDVAGIMFPMVTVDEMGGPHPGLASFAEVFAPDPTHLRVALWANSSAARNLSERRRFALCVIARGEAYYVKGEAEDLGADHPDLKGQHLFWVTLSAVYQDSEPGMELTGMTFRAADPRTTGWWSELFEAVRKSTDWPG